MRAERAQGGKMGTGSGARSGWSAAAAVLFAGLLAGCGQAPRPAPVVGVVPAPATITIERGQTLSGIALAYRVPLRELAALNHLSPPYKILAGGELLLPPTATAAAMPAVPSATAAPAAVAAVPPPTPARSVPAPAQPPPQPPPTVRSAALAPQPAPVPGAGAEPGRIGPPAPSAPAGAASGRPPAAPPAGAENAPPATHGGVFAWPVRGHIIEGYGAGPDGTHNDGINIAAPRGTPVDSAGAGVVAYAGDELRGYGNLILIKHPGGWISAYAHCQAILVKPGQKVGKGEVIARVGSTGNVTTPQLHFELRRGDQPVDPRGLLPPLSSAAARPPSAG